MEVQPLGFETIRPCPAAPRDGAGEALFGRQIEHQGQVGPVGADDDLLQPVDQARRRPPRRALIGAGGIREAITDDPGASVERGADEMVDMVDAGGGKGDGLRRRAFLA